MPVLGQYDKFLKTLHRFLTPKLLLERQTYESEWKSLCTDQVNQLRGVFVTTQLKEIMAQTDGKQQDSPAHRSEPRRQARGRVDVE